MNPEYYSKLVSKAQENEGIYFDAFISNRRQYTLIENDNPNQARLLLGAS